jgi:RecB family endonuclease NucS
MIVHGFEVYRNTDSDIVIRQKSAVDPDENDVIVVSQHEAGILAKAIWAHINLIEEDLRFLADSRGGE